MGKRVVLSTLVVDPLISWQIIRAQYLHMKWTGLMQVFLLSNCSLQEKSSFFHESEEDRNNI
jgi:hypothetical protein